MERKVYSTPKSQIIKITINTTLLAASGGGEEQPHMGASKQMNPENWNEDNWE
jgi:hypothetical protein